ncbi:MAG: SDR family oxidoreductase [Chloracidobacterium sp.]|uniref:SDR family oxidoreductase n=1 Tax=Chloracidobacterium validum TaxID=2821543 RepID=A0ABX8B4K1_9BACT|nr:SDR family oxidoreductase [Chloracidobacterium validum]QUW01899.1 SDR family oxidoreductase [Chloracidobacterium validum]
MAFVMLVTGSASGIGRYVAEHYYRAGHRVVFADLSAPKLERICAELPAQDGAAALPVAFDVRDERAWERVIADTVDRWGQLDVLCNIAGYLQVDALLDVPTTAVHAHLDINAKGVIFGTLVAARQMRRQPAGGHIINVASLAGIAAVPGLALYTASKFAVRGFSLAAAQELAPHNVAVTVICPDAVQTPMLDLQVHRQEAALTFSGGRILRVEEVAAAIEEARRRRPLEMTLPRRRGWLAKLTSLYPSLTPLLAPYLQRRGQQRQAKLQRKSHDATCLTSSDAE